MSKHNLFQSKSLYIVLIKIQASIHFLSVPACVVPGDITALLQSLCVALVLYSKVTHIVKATEKEQQLTSIPTVQIHNNMYALGFIFVCVVYTFNCISLALCALYCVVVP